MATSKRKPAGKVDGSVVSVTMATQDLLLWLRKHRISVSHVRVGSGEVELTGIVDAGADRERIRDGLKNTEEERQGIYQEMAGALGMPPEQEPQGEDVSEPTEEDDE